MIRVVLDTAVLVSAVISPAGPNAQVLDLVTAGKIRPYVTAAVVEEYDRVFEYERLKHLDKRRVANVRALLKATSVRVKSRGRLKISSHEQDNRIYECALAAKADYIITENTKHFLKPYKWTKIVKAGQLLKLMESGQTQSPIPHAPRRQPI
jgi:putative PIN family toxin of toxin-antitoxin system